MDALAILTVLVIKTIMNIAYTTTSLSTGLYFSRPQFLALIETALRLGEYKFARTAALEWLANYPGDLAVSLGYAQALTEDGQFEQALPILDGLCRADPEYSEALNWYNQALARLSSQPNSPKNGNSKAKKTPQQSYPSKPIPHSVQLARRSLRKKEFAHAEAILHQSLLNDSDNPLTAVTHLELLAAQEDIPIRSKIDLAQHYYQRWPDCLVCMLLLAHWMMVAQAGENQTEQAVNLLHQAAARDVSGQVARRLWGAHHRYQSLWPEHLAIYLNLLIPPQVSASLGWNRLADGTPPPVAQAFPPTNDQVTRIDHTEQDEQAEATPSPEKAKEQRRRAKLPPEELIDLQQGLESIAARLNRPGVTRLDGRFPVYVILSLRKKLEERYGVQGVANLEAEMQSVARAVQAGQGSGSQPRWNTRILFADDPTSTAPLELNPVTHADPWEIKLALSDLDEALARRGEMIGALLIVGGPEIVPFHYLPNPVDDPDLEVASDNPYGTRDENYFIPEWPVGRLPDAAWVDAPPSTRADYLIHGLRKITQAHRRLARNLAWYQRWWQAVTRRWQKRANQHGSFGYSAAVWKQASQQVYKVIGQAKDLFSSPPIRIEKNHLPRPFAHRLHHARLGYFNLHGLADAPEWYGQRDPFDARENIDYPVALRPQDIQPGSQHIPEVVFSEACYGGHILHKNPENSLALRFLSAGCRAFVGCTSMAYGSLSEPLIAADMLGIFFWRYLQDGLPAGEALRRGKIALAQEMHRRQGYLDGEDQKTLISFIFYGDPLARLPDLGSRPKGVLRAAQASGNVKLICDRVCCSVASQALDEQTLAVVKQTVAQYLPGMADAEMTASLEHADCQAADHTCPTSQFDGKGKPKQMPERQVVTLSKQVKMAGQPHTQYARVTVDKLGKVVKLAISR